MANQRLDPRYPMVRSWRLRAVLALGFVALLGAGEVAAAPEAFFGITLNENRGASTFSGHSFTLTNQSTAGEKITSISLDISSSIFPDIVFDPDGIAGDIVAKCFSADSGKAETGWISPADKCTDPFSGPHNDGWDIMSLDFADFDPSETFTFSIDIDHNSTRGSAGNAPGGAISGFELSGSALTVEFDSGATLSTSIFPQPGSEGGGQNLVKAGGPSAPSVQLVGLSDPATTATASQTVRVTGVAGEDIRLYAVEASMLQGTTAIFDRDPFEANTARAITEVSATIGGGGTVDIPVTLTAESAHGGLNHFFAAVEDSDGSGRTSPRSNVAIARLTIPCSGDGDCDDSNACTGSEVCEGSVCEPDEDLVCDDGLTCTGIETCSTSNGCKPGTPVDCEDGIACTADTCDEATLGCTHSPNDASCDDGNPCNGAEVCGASGCESGAGSVDCDDGIACTVDSCDETTLDCIHVPEDSACDDGLSCNGAETCGASGCESGTTVDCDDGVSCTDDACTEPGGQCDHTPVDASCSDGDACNGTETCGASGCESGSPVDCDDGIACTIDSCATESGACSNEPDDSICDDGAFCNGDEQCSAVNGCVDGDDPCDDSIACTVDSCNESGDSCGFAPSDAACTDGSACNGSEVCSEVSGCGPGDDAPACSELESFCAEAACTEPGGDCEVTPRNEGQVCDAATDACRLDSVCVEGECTEAPLCDPECERCDDGNCASLCGNPIDSEVDAVTTADALFVLRAALSLETCAPCVCDVVNAGAITATDTLAVLQVAVGLDVRLDCP